MKSCCGTKSERWYAYNHAFLNPLGLYPSQPNQPTLGFPQSLLLEYLWNHEMLFTFPDTTLFLLLAVALFYSIYNFLAQTQVLKKIDYSIWVLFSLNPVCPHFLSWNGIRTSFHGKSYVQTSIYWIQTRLSRFLFMGMEPCFLLKRWVVQQSLFLVMTDLTTGTHPRNYVFTCLVLTPEQVPHFLIDALLLLFKFKKKKGNFEWYAVASKSILQACRFKRGMTLNNHGWAKTLLVANHELNFDGFSAVTLVMPTNSLQNEYLSQLGTKL